jgi:hypothetical protein
MTNPLKVAAGLETARGAIEASDATRYEQAICCAAVTFIQVYDIGGVYVSDFPLMWYAGCFPQMIKNGILHKVDNWPYPQYAISSDIGTPKAWDILKKYGYHPYYIVPGLTSIEERRNIDNPW